VRDLHEDLVLPGPQRNEGACQLPQLTPTQNRVFRLVHAGLSNKEIARELGIAEATVKVHMTAVMRRLNVRNRTQVAIIANRLHGSQPATAKTKGPNISGASRRIFPGGGNNREAQQEA